MHARNLGSKWSIWQSLKFLISWQHWNPSSIGNKISVVGLYVVVVGIIAIGLCLYTCVCGKFLLREGLIYKESELDIPPLIYIQWWAIKKRTHFLAANVPTISEEALFRVLVTVLENAKERNSMTIFEVISKEVASVANIDVKDLVVSRRVGNMVKCRYHYLKSVGA